MQTAQDTLTDMITRHLVASGAEAESVPAYTKVGEAAYPYEVTKYAIGDFLFLRAAGGRGITALEETPYGVERIHVEDAFATATGLHLYAALTITSKGNDNVHVSLTPGLFDSQGQAVEKLTQIQGSARTEQKNRLIHGVLHQLDVEFGGGSLIQLAPNVLFYRVGPYFVAIRSTHGDN